MPEYLTPGVYVEEVSGGVHTIYGVGTTNAAFIDSFTKGPMGKPTLVSSTEEFTDIFGGANTHSEASYGILQFFINGGRKAVVVRTAGRRHPGKRALTQGLNVLASDNHNPVNILCIPAAVNLDDNNMRFVYASAIEYCQKKRALLIIDIPERVGEPGKMIEWATANTMLRSSNAVVYFPRLKIVQPGDPRQKREVGSSGTIAGIYARTDIERGVWKAPAGNEAVLKNIAGLAYNVTQEDNSVLSHQGINCIRKFPEKGFLCWGARIFDTIDQGDLTWKYINVRRLYNYIEESIDRGTQWAVFEPNGERLWEKIKQTTADFLHTLWTRGALVGSTPEEAYFVRCDRSTTTQEEIEEGIVTIMIGFAPKRPAEFVIINIRQRTA